MYDIYQQSVLGVKKCKVNNYGFVRSLPIIGNTNPELFIAVSHKQCFSA